MATSNKYQDNLAEVFAFNPEDLKLNRQGKMGTSQRRRLLWMTLKRLPLLLFLVLLIPPFIGLGLELFQENPPADIAQWMRLLLIVIFLGFLYMGWRSFRANLDIWANLRQGNVQHIEGQVEHIKENDGEFDIFYLQINDQRFWVERRQYDAVDAGSYCIYHSEALFAFPTGRKTPVIIAIEKL